MVLIDTDILIFFLKGNKKVIEAIKNIFQKEDIALSIISLAEMYEGIFSDRKKMKDKLKQLNGVLSLLKIINIDNEVCRIFGILRGELRKRNKLVDNFDLLIAATCITNNYKLYTGNTKHFKKIPELKVYYKTI